LRDGNCDALDLSLCATPKIWEEHIKVEKSATVIPLLSLVVTVLVAFVAPLVTWVVTRQQIAVTAQETWMREFRAKVAALVTSTIAESRAKRAIHNARESGVEKDKLLAEVNEKRLLEIRDAMYSYVQEVKLLIAEKGSQYEAFARTLSEFLLSDANCSFESLNPRKKISEREVLEEAENVLKRERAIIETDPGVFRSVWIALRAQFWGGRRR
jgi:hypothetical protein